MQLDFLFLSKNIHIPLMALDKPWIPCVQHPRKSKNVCAPLSKPFVLHCFIWPLASRRVRAGRKEFFILGCDLANLLAVIKQTFCGMCWWTITTLIWSAWARRSQHLASFFRADGCAWCWQVLPSGPNIHCYYLTDKALRWDSASYYWSVLISRKEIDFL